MDLKKVFNVNNGLAALSIAASAATTITACDAVKKNKDWKHFILPTSLFLVSSAAAVTLAVRGNKAEAKVVALAGALVALESSIANYKTAVSNVYGEESQPLIHRNLVDMAGKEKPEPQKEKDLCFIGYGYNDYLMLSRDDRDQIEKEMNKILRIEGKVTVAHFFDLCEELNIIDDNIVRANAESTLYGWNTIMVGRRNYITIKEEVYNDGADDVYYLDFDCLPSMTFQEELDDLPWEE